MKLILWLCMSVCLYIGVFEQSLQVVGLSGLFMLLALSLTFEDSEVDEED